MYNTLIHINFAHSDDVTIYLLETTQCLSHKSLSVISVDVRILTARKVRTISIFTFKKMNSPASRGLASVFSRSHSATVSVEDSCEVKHRYSRDKLSRSVHRTSLFGTFIANRLYR